MGEQIRAHIVVPFCQFSGLDCDALSAHNMRMELQDFPTAEEALKELSVLTSTIQEFLIDATAVVIPYFAERGLTTNRRLATDMLRYELLQQLREAGIPVENENDQITVPVLSNNGIECSCDGWTVKVLRSAHDIPPPGHSDKRSLFFGQQLPLIQFSGIQAGHDLRPNVVILWDFDYLYTTLALRLAAPWEVSGRWGPVGCFWNVPVPEPTNAAETEEPEIRLKDVEGIEGDVHLERGDDLQR